MDIEKLKNTIRFGTLEDKNKVSFRLNPVLVNQEVFNALCTMLLSEQEKERFYALHTINSYFGEFLKNIDQDHLSLFYNLIFDEYVIVINHAYWSYFYIGAPILDKLICEYYLTTSESTKSRIVFAIKRGVKGHNSRKVKLFLDGIQSTDVLLKYYCLEALFYYLEDEKYKIDFEKFQITRNTFILILNKAIISLLSIENEYYRECVLEMSQKMKLIYLD